MQYVFNRGEIRKIYFRYFKQKNGIALMRVERGSAKTHQVRLKYIATHVSEVEPRDMYSTFAQH